jgi:hypothetical protein
LAAAALSLSRSSSGYSRCLCHTSTLKPWTLSCRVGRQGGRGGQEG